MVTVPIYFLFISAERIALVDHLENEMLTDLAAVFLGVGKVLLNGLVNALDDYGLELATMGYLSPELIAYSQHRLNTKYGVAVEFTTSNLVSRACDLLRSAALE